MKKTIKTLIALATGTTAGIIITAGIFSLNLTSILYTTGQAMKEGILWPIFAILIALVGIGYLTYLKKA